MKRLRLLAPVAYIATIVGANYAIHHLGHPGPVPAAPHTLPVWSGLAAPSGVYFVALALVLRNVVQRQLGRWAAVLAILAGAAISWYVADPALAKASAAAFLLSEALDMAVYTRLRRYGQVRAVLPASLVGAAVDSWLFLRNEVGRMEWASPQDWMCEPWITGKTGLTVAEHQQRTIDNYLTLRDLAADLPFVPVLQGWELDDYRRHVDAYATAGIDLTAERPVGVGSVCRRQHTDQIDRIVTALTDLGLSLHGFGVKTSGLRAYGPLLYSADSMAWSFRGRRVRPAECGSTSHASEANCLTFALAWRQRALTASVQPAQLSFGWSL